MPISINAPVVISVFWTAFKTIITDKFLLLQYHDDGVVYTIFAFDSPSISYSTTIWKSTVPDEIISGGYSQATNDSDKSDFETNFAPIANKTIGLQAVFGGSPIVSRPLLIAGSDGTNARFLSTDTSGHPSIVGAAADGAAITGNPIRIGGSDGTNTQDITTDTSGRLLVSGAAADGAAVTGNPVLMGGQDGTNAQSILTDTTGRQVIVGAAADGAAVTGNPVLIGGTDGTNAQTAELRNVHPVGDVQGIIVRNIETTYPTYYAIFDRIAPATNKYMATLFNTSSTRKVIIQRMWVYNWQFATVTGVILEQYLTKITARTAGTSVTIYAEDTGDTLSSGISADTNSSAVTENHILRRFMSYSEEAGTNLGQLNGARAAGDDTTTLILDKKDGTRGLTLRENQGVSIRNVTNSTVGTISYVIEFTDEVA